jgi:hypothetical protein
VMSTVAVVLALTGGATAIALTLPKNSIKSKQLAKGAVHTSDIAKDAVTGAKAKESSFGKVPSAAHADTAGTAVHADTAARADSAAVADSIGSLAPQDIVKEKTVSSESFTDALVLTLSGFPSFEFRCHQNNPANDEDDVVAFSRGSGQLSGAITSGLITAQAYPLDTPDVFTVSGKVEGGGSEYGTQDRIVHVQFEATLVGSGKTILVQGGGFDAAGPGCAGQLHAYTTG